MEADDDTRRVNNVFLGPRGYLLPWQARYSAYGIGLVLFVGQLAILQAVGVPRSFWFFVFPFAVAVGVTRRLGTLISYDLPVRALAVMFMHELTAPRPVDAGATSTLTPGRVQNRWKGITTYERPDR